MYSATVGANSAENCSNCPAGTWSSLRAAASEMDCNLCGNGTFSYVVGAKDAGVCKNCPAGFYSAKMGADKVIFPNSEHIGLIFAL